MHGSDGLARGAISELSKYVRCLPLRVYLMSVTFQAQIETIVHLFHIKFLGFEPMASLCLYL